MRAVSKDLLEASWFSMAIEKKIKLVLSGIVILLAAGFVLWYFTMRKWSLAYQQTNATWKIQGHCADVQNGTPITGADITAYFWEPVTFKHHWRNPPPLRRTDKITRTDDQGNFEILGEGGHVQIKIRAEGYRVPEAWEDWQHSAMNGIIRVETNVVLTMHAARK